MLQCGCESNCLGHTVRGEDSPAIFAIKEHFRRERERDADLRSDLANASTLLRTALTMLLDSEKADQKFFKLVNDFLTSQGTKEG